MRLLRPLLGLALLVGLVSLTDTTALAATFLQADPKLFGLALVLAIAANLICVYRWQVVCDQLGIRASYQYLLGVYAQGISANSVLPGGIVGGDAWRSLAIAKLTDEGQKHRSVLTVLLDRVSGFWGLTWLSLAAGLIAFVLDSRYGTADSAGILGRDWLNTAPGQMYLLTLLLIAMAPFAGRLIHMGWLRRYESQHHSKWLQIAIQIINAYPVLRLTLIQSILIQAVTVASFWACLTSVGLGVSWWLLAALCGGIFLSGMLPAGIGGYGARELGAIAFMSPFGLSKEGVLAGSILFGLTASIQGVLGLWFWFRAKRYLAGLSSSQKKSKPSDLHP
jgi:uncharacterized membrane protein YbhN (UPF0104 family)